MPPYPPYDYYARRVLPDNIMPGYRPGDGIYAQVVDEYGWVIGVDVDAARPDVLERPTDRATREKWVDYVLTQEPGTAREELDDLGRNDLIARVTKPEKKSADEESAEKRVARKTTKAAAADKSENSESGE
jgi:hypothetical protein